MYIGQSYLLPSLTNAIAIIIRLRKTNTTNNIIINIIAAIISKISHVFLSDKYDLKSALKLVIAGSNVGSDFAANSRYVL